MPVDLDLDYRLPIPPGLDRYAIGVIGAGFIVRDCHLPAYRRAGLRVAGIASRTRSRADEVARLRDVPQVYDAPASMLEDPAIDVVDIAVPPDRQLAVVREVVRHADHVKAVLAQKPLAMNPRDAREIVDRCRDAGITLGVNQNMRHDQSVRALRCLLERGELGEPVLATIDMRAIPHWMPWAEGLDSLTTYLMSIHHLDTFRYWFGDPERVLASTRPDPRTTFPHRDGINLYILEYASGLRATAWDDVWAGPDPFPPQRAGDGEAGGAAGDIGIRWRVEGTEGLALGTIGWPAWPEHRPSTLDFRTRRRPGEWLKPRWTEAWFPDAFAGPMAELLMALEAKTDPPISGTDNLKTIALVDAVCRSAREHRVIEP